MATIASPGSWTISQEFGFSEMFVVGRLNRAQFQAQITLLEVCDLFIARGCKSYNCGWAWLDARLDNWTETIPALDQMGRIELKRALLDGLTSDALPRALYVD